MPVAAHSAFSNRRHDDGAAPRPRCRGRRPARRAARAAAGGAASAPARGHTSPHLGAVVRFRPSLPPQLKELAILVTGRHCHAQLEWHIHEQMARKAGLPQAVIDDVHAGRRPTALDDDGLAVFDYAEELNRRKTVGEETYRRVLDRWQAVGVVELTALIGYYTMVAMTLNCHDIPLPDGVAPPLPSAPE